MLKQRQPRADRHFEDIPPIIVGAVDPELYDASTSLVSSVADSATKAMKDNDHFGAKQPEAEALAGGELGSLAAELNNELFWSSSRSNWVAPFFEMLCVLGDPVRPSRSITSISCVREAPFSIAVAFSNLRFQQLQSSLSYLWDAASPEAFKVGLRVRDTSINALDTCPWDSTYLAAGLNSGRVAIFKIKEAGGEDIEPVWISDEARHFDPVYSVKWVQKGFFLTFCSVSTDGQLLYWRFNPRSHKGYLRHKLLLSSQKVAEGVLRGTCLEHSETAGPQKLLVGTKQGLIVQVFTRKKPEVQKTYGAESAEGPVLGVKRNPHFPKYFLSIRGQKARLWHENLKEEIQIMELTEAYPTSVSWSQQSPGLFFLGTSTGEVQVCHVQSESPLVQVQLSRSPVTALLSCQQVEVGGTSAGQLYVYQSRINSNLEQTGEALESTFRRKKQKEIEAQYEM